MKTVLISGASSGFGEAIARLLHKSGFRLVLLARRMDRLEKIASELGENVYAAACDLREKNDVDRFFHDLPEEFRNIDILVNNAGLARGLATADECDLLDWEEMVDTNIKGLLYLTRTVLPNMKSRNEGHVINISSVSATVPYKGSNVYGGTKAFVSQFSKNLRTDLFGTNIRVTNIEPGMAETEFSQVRFGGDTQKANSVYANTRHLEAADIADCVLWSIERPLRVNIDNIVIMPIDQTYAGMNVNRQTE